MYEHDVDVGHLLCVLGYICQGLPVRTDPWKVRDGGRDDL